MRALSARLVPNQPGLVRIFGWSIAILLALHMGAQLVQRIDAPAEFYSYYAAAQFVARGEPVARLYDDAWFGAEAAKLMPGLREIFNANMPLTALAHMPLLLFRNPVEARYAWTILSVAALLLFIEALIRIAGAGPAARPYWYVAALVSQLVRTNLYQGQVYIFVALGLVLALEAWRQNRDLRAGAALAGLMAYKTAGALLWPVAAASRRWRILFWGVALFALVVIATWPVIRWEGWSAYLHYLKEKSAAGLVRATAYQSVEGFVRHLLSDQVQRNLGRPLLALPLETARGIATVINLGLLALTLWVAWRHPRDELVLGAAILQTLFAVSLSQTHTYVTAFLPIAMLANRLNGRYRQPEGLIFWAGSALMILPLRSGSHRLFDGWAALLAYPQLYGALVLWALCLTLAGRRQTI